jgi:hypothetical protein
VRPNLFLVTLENSCATLQYYVLVNAATMEQAVILAQWKHKVEVYSALATENGSITDTPFVLDEIGISQVLECHQ